jgi:hypothetical protein
MQQDSFLISDQLTDKLGLFHLFDQGIRKDIEVCPVAAREVLVHSGLLELLVCDCCIADGHPAVALPSVVGLKALISRDVLDTIPLEMQLQEISLYVKSNRAISLSLWQVFNKDIGYEVDSAAKRTVVVVEFLSGYRRVLKRVFF